MEIKERIKNLYQWSSLRKLRTNKFISSTYIWLAIVPVVAKLLSGMNESLTFSVGGVDHTFILSLPFSWQVFFLSALMFSIGNILFFIFAPDFIKLYSDYGSFFSMGGTINHIEIHKNDEVYKEEKEDRKIRNLFKIDFPKNSDYEELKYSFWYLYNYFNDKYFFYRLLILFFYVIGILLFSGVVISNVAWTFYGFLF